MKWQSAAVLLCALVYIIDQGQAFAPSLHVSLPGQTLRSLGLRAPTLHVGPRSISGRLSTTLHASGKEEAGEVKSGGCLSGVVIAITGNFDGKREEVMELLKGNGAASVASGRHCVVSWPGRNALIRRVPSRVVSPPGGKSRTPLM
eukprot:1379515-Rhodomonas_salina.4